MPLKSAKAMAKKRKRKTSHLRKWSGSVEEFCDLLQEKAMTHNQGFCHYTILRNLVEILNPCELDGGECLFFRMSPAGKLNDGADLQGGKNAYVLSLLHSCAESVAMWAVYGVPKKEAVRIRFPKSAISKWLKSATNNCSPCFFVKGKNAQSRQYIPVFPVRIRFADVLYVSRLDARFPYIGEHDGLVYGAPGNKSWMDFAQTQPDVGLDLFFKNRGWAYEKETRLVVEFDEPLAIKNGSTYVYVDFTDVIRSVLPPNNKKAGSRILLGPWFDEGILRRKLNNQEHTPDLSSLLPVIDPQNRSNYLGELKMRSVCEFCNKGNPQTLGRSKNDSCSCPYRDNVCNTPCTNQKGESNR